MATGRNASLILVGVVSTFILFVVFTLVSQLNVLDEHAYTMNIGWQAEPQGNSAAGECAGPLINGFPLASRRITSLDINPSGCPGDKNPLANAMNYAIYFALACLLSAGVVSAARSKL